MLFNWHFIFIVDKSDGVSDILTYPHRNYGLHLVVLMRADASIALVDWLIYNHFLELVVATNTQPDILFDGESQSQAHEVLDFRM